MVENIYVQDFLNKLFKPKILTLYDLAAVSSGYPLVSSKLAKTLGFKGYLPLPLSLTPRSKRELGQSLLSRVCARGKGKG